MKARGGESFLFKNIIFERHMKRLYIFIRYLKYVKSSSLQPTFGLRNECRAKKYCLSQAKIKRASEVVNLTYQELVLVAYW